MSDPYTLHQLRAALAVARLLDEQGNTGLDADAAYERALTQGEHPAGHLRDAEALLVASGLLNRTDERVVPSERLHVVAMLDDVTAIDTLRSLLDDSVSVTDQEAARVELGQAGEEYIVELCRDELRSLGRSDLADRVQRVSLVNDSLGYDVVAPMVVGAVRRLEVKTQGTQFAQRARFFLTRNEYETGKRHPDTWALTICCAPEGRDGPVRLVGWCRADTLAVYLPHDQNGRWTEALVQLPLSVLASGYPPAL